MNKLTDLERRRVLEVLGGARFVDRAPLEVYAELLDEGTYLCSVSTMYRVLHENAQVTERRRLARHPAKACPELVATAARQVYSWDITKLAGPAKGQYFDAYVMIDVYSRYIVGVHVHTHESGLLARELMEQIFAVHGGVSPVNGASLF
ncbi:DDE-type integrase/transposase/recombinase [Rhodococcus sp. (in: high G+C Gram-positive bacteria)]|uniref:DDE-type integrase/transposase/recombinase n=1 Tax=Rhodococcus sp. TaxID=1831 RepID=UPI003BAEE5D1